jgi:hypothetical protein
MNNGTVDAVSAPSLHRFALVNAGEEVDLQRLFAEL